MDAIEKRELEKRMLDKAKEYLALVQDYIPHEAHAAMMVWPDHISVTIYKEPGNKDKDPCLVSAWADPRLTPMEVSRI